MGKYAIEVVKQAQAWLGKNENDGSHKEIIDIYNSHEPLARGYKMKYTDSWCSCFVSSVSIKLGYTDIIPTEVGCERHIELFKNIGEWIEDESVKPEAGWIIFYDWEDKGNGDNTGWSDHIGIVEKVSGNTITVIEGNINNAVGRRKLKVNGQYIRGYGEPKYDIEEQPVEPTPEEENKEEFEMAKTYKNGSTAEIVYADTNLSVRIGSLNPWEKCECLSIVNGRYLVKYKVDGTNNYKCGFVEYAGGVK